MKKLEAIKEQITGKHLRNDQLIRKDSRNKIKFETKRLNSGVSEDESNLEDELQNLGFGMNMNQRAALAQDDQ